MAKFAPPPGTADLFPDEVVRWRALEEAARRVFELYGYGELRTPVFEYTEVFQRGLGNETEVVRKEMYTFEDRGGRSLTLRPEGTAGVMRALLNTDVMNGVEQRVFYMGPMFRGERPAAGRRRQFHQIGVENVGRVSPELDAECIAMLMHFLEETGIHGAHLSINTRGVMSDRPAAAELLRNYFGKYIGSMCEDCRARFENNIWRILDCKQAHCHEIVCGAPDYVSAFSADSRAYFDRTLKALDLLGVPYTVDPLLVRGLDYYVHGVFEITHDALGPATAIAGGGRYELFLPEQNKPVMGVGFAAGMERLLLTLDALGNQAPERRKSTFFLASLGSGALARNIKLAGELRHADLRVAIEVEPRSLKAQLRAADRAGARYALLRGDDELARGVVVVRDLAGGTQEEIAENDLQEWIHKKAGIKC